MRILVTGGLGYIGSHTVVELLEKGFEVTIVDNLYNAKRTTIEKIKEITKKDLQFIEMDVTNLEELDCLCEKHVFNAIIHFAGYKAVGESVSKPLMYYYNNLVSTINLAKMAVKYNINKFIFSSSATVYGNGVPPFTEQSPLLERTNPYGESKAINERILMDTQKANPNLCLTLLRYFNPIGAHKTGLIGETPLGIPNNLMPYITQVAKGKREKILIFGNDYETNDGTGIRDYIHVVDLAKGHVAALEVKNKGINIYNLGTGIGTSVLEIIQTFIAVNKIDIPYEFATRRLGDVAISFADVSKAKKELNWVAQLTLEDMVSDAWRFEKNLEE